MLGDVTSFNRYVSTSTNAKEFQKRTFFYGQDTWRVNHKLTLNLGVRWELYFPESVNGAGQWRAAEPERRLPARGRYRRYRLRPGLDHRQEEAVRASHWRHLSVERRRPSSAPATDAASTPVSSAPSSATPSPRTCRFWPTSKSTHQPPHGEAFTLSVGPGGLHVGSEGSLQRPVAQSGIAR